MKKISILLCLFVLCSAFQCNDEPIDDELLTQDELCEAAIIRTSEAEQAFSEATDNNFAELCNMYRDMLEAQILTCGDGNGDLQILINQLGDCSQTQNIDCATAIAEKNEAEELFNNSTDVNYMENCNALKTAIQNFLDICGDNQEALNQLENLGNCILTTGNQASGEITVTAGTFSIVFDEITVEEDNGLLKINGETSADNDYSIYFEVTEGQVGQELINAEFEIIITSEFTPSTESMNPFTSSITENIPNTLKGTFSGLTKNANNADLNLTSGNIDITY